jgi:hypothetical protein
MSELRLAAILLGSTLVLAGCNIQATSPDKPAEGTSNAPAPAPEAPAPAPAAPAEAEGGAAPSAEVQGQARQNFTVVNRTGHVVMTLNVSPASETSWGPDILGRDVLADGESAQVTFERGENQCIWDIRATYQDGDTTDMRGVNLCQVATVTLTP